MAVTNSTSNNKLRVAVLGVGSLGQHHARIYSEMDQAGEVALAGIYDANADTANKVAAKHQCRVFASVSEAAENADAVNIATPTTTHFEIAKQLLGRDRHVFIEKPMTDSSAQAAELIRLAQEHKCLLQVGHVERFNPVYKYLESAAPEPRFIECARLSPYPARSTDVGVVLDLMIHDLDIVLAFVKSPVTSVDSVGIPVLSRSEDIANARLRFANGCVANLTVSRVSRKRMREIRVFSGGASPASYISLDYRAQEGFIYRLAREDEKESALAKLLALAGSNTSVVSEFAGKKIMREPVPIAKDEPLKLELQHFVQCVREQQTPVVSGESAKRALDLAFEITGQLEKANLEALNKLKTNPLKI
ncbi:MAG TPA: Gfo/Idh/MocA family oxidoreductase [Verrucomicrobiae bacterium]|nr:Gfo/Idh/MocA family oxidoreductase [Verrucomicrobiae bacterium]